MVSLLRMAFLTERSVSYKQVNNKSKMNEIRLKSVDDEIEKSTDE